MSADENIRVAIVEDEQTVRDSLGLLIDGIPGYSCVGTFPSMEDALERIGDAVPHVLLLDIHLPGMSGTEGVKVIQEQYPAVRVLILSVYDDEEKVFESICNGASGYLLKKTPPARLLEAIQQAHEGGSPMTPEIARKVVDLFQKTGPPEKLDTDLTPQEVRLLRMLADGYSYKAAADRLKISINTIRVYIRSIYEKLHVHSKSEAVSKAIRTHIID